MTVRFDAEGAGRDRKFQRFAESLGEFVAEGLNALDAGSQARVAGEIERGGKVVALCTASPVRIQGILACADGTSVALFEVTAESFEPTWN